MPINYFELIECFNGRCGLAEYCNLDLYSPMIK